MHESEHPGIQSRCRFPGLPGGGVQDIPRPIGLLIVERCVVDEEIGAPDHILDVGQAMDRPGVSGVDDLPPGAGFSHHVTGVDIGLDTLMNDADHLPALETPEERTRGDAERHSPVAVEPARPFVLFQDVPERRGAVERGKRTDGIAIEGHDRAMFEGMPGDGKAPCMPADPLHDIDELIDPGGAVDREGVGPPHERECLDKPEDAEEVIGMPVGDEDGIHGETRPGTHHLLLGTLPAVKEQGVGAPADQDGGGVSLRRREGACCAEEVDVQGLSGYTNHFLNAARLRFASSSVRPSITATPPE